MASIRKLPLAAEAIAPLLTNKGLPGRKYNARGDEGSLDFETRDVPRAKPRATTFLLRPLAGVSPNTQRSLK